MDVQNTPLSEAPEHDIVQHDWCEVFALSYYLVSCYGCDVIYVHSNGRINPHPRDI